jgi:hypothetical protein
VLLLLSVMDGFVNDVDASRRRGLHARGPDEMVAWDSVVGHHLGLTHAHAGFTKTFKRTSTDEVRERRELATRILAFSTCRPAVWHDAGRGGLALP